MNQQHFLVVYKIENDKVYVSDPATSRLVYTKEEFCNHWLSGQTEGNEGYLLLLQLMYLIISWAIMEYLLLL